MLPFNLPLTCATNVVVWEWMIWTDYTVSGARIQPGRRNDMRVCPCHSSYLEGNVIPPTKKLSLCFGRGVDQMIFLFYIVSGGVGDVMGGDAPEEAVYVVPLIQELRGMPATSLFLVPLNDGTQGFDLIWVVEAVEAYEFGVAAHGEDACDIQ